MSKMASEEVDSDQRVRSESLLTEKPSTEDLSISNTAKPSHSDPKTPPPSTVQTSVAPSERLKAITDSALRFVANASNETLGACAVGLAASTYLVLGRLGLVLIGAFGGILLHATWDSQGGQDGQGTGAEVAQRRRELGAEIVKRTLDWRNRNGETVSSENGVNKVEASTIRKVLDFSQYPPETANALTAFSDSVIKDYVKYWYSPILPTEDTFPADCRQVLVAFIHSFSNHISRKRAADPFLDFLANSTSVLIVFLQELGVALKASQRQEADEAIKTYLKFQPESNLANVLNKNQQKQKLHLVADDILQSFLDSKTYNCLPARSFLREVLAGLILDGTIISCSKPEWINGWIIYLLEDGEPELLNAIDAGVSELEGIVKDGESPPEAKVQHQRRMSRAEHAMEEAMLEAQRMNDMIAEEARKRQNVDNEDTVSTTTTTTTDNGIVTPSSSGSDYHAPNDASMNGAMVFDSEGNTIPSVTSSPTKQRAPTFTSFDQLEQMQPPTALRPTLEAPTRTETMVAVPLTLHNASVNIMDMGAGNDQVPLRQKPEDDMMIQIEPAGSRYPGWIVTRQYAAFEPLSETLRRIAHISGVQEFNLQYPELPQWRGRSRATVIADLERYLKAALKSNRLAESEAMKRFLEKETGLEKIPSSQKNVFIQSGAALQDVGKGFVNVLGQGGKGIQTGFTAGGKVFQTGGKAVLGGVTGVFGAVANNAPKRPGLSPSNSTLSQPGSGFMPRQSQDLLRTSTDIDGQIRGSPRPSSSTRSSTDILRSPKDFHNQALDMEGNLNLPPPPDEITDEYVPTASSSARKPPTLDSTRISRPSTPTSTNNTSQSNLTSSKIPQSSPEKDIDAPPAKPSITRPQDIPVSEEETRMTVELMFALTTELFSLSSAWTFRLSLLTAAKTYLLRPKNPQLNSIRLVLQESVIDSNLSDEAMATHIRKLRENSLPTEEELKNWPKEPSPEEKERLRVKAKKLLVERGMPAALNSVVGAAASGEALGKVFDCLQNPDVARGLIFALMLQALRTVTQ